MKALVLATPISTPARVRNASRHSRTMALVATLHTVSVWRMPRLCAWRSAARVSAVSPDWLMVTTSVSGSGTEAR